MKRKRTLARLTFLKRRRDKNTAPTCVKPKFTKKTQSVNKTLHEASLKLIRDQTNEFRQQNLVLKLINITRTTPTNIRF